MVNRGGLSPFKRVLQGFKAVKGVIVLEVVSCFFVVFKVFSLRPGSTVHFIYGVFPSQNLGQNPDQKSGQNLGT